MTTRRHIPKGGRSSSNASMDESDENQYQENVMVSFRDIGNFGNNTRSRYIDDGGRSVDSSLDDEDISLDNFSVFDDLIGIADDGLDDTVDEGYNNHNNNFNDSGNQMDYNNKDKNSRMPRSKCKNDGSVGTADVDYSISTESNTDGTDSSYDSDDDDDDSSSVSSGSSSDSDFRLLVTESAIPGSVEYSKRKQKKILRNLKRAKRKSKNVLEVDLLPIAASETKCVRLWRNIVIVSILLLGAMFTTWIHLLLNNDKDSNNEYQSSAIISNAIFLEDAKAIESLCLDRWKIIQDSIESIATTIPYVAIHPNLSSSSLTSDRHNEITTRSGTAASFLKSVFFHHSDATEANTTLDIGTTASNFPNIRIPHYEIFANTVRKSADGIIDSLSFVPLVYATANATSNTSDDIHNTILREWNTFSQEQYPLWIDDSIRSIAATTPSSLQNWSRTALQLGHPLIWHYNDDNIYLDINSSSSHSTNLRQFYGPIWHVSPLIETTSSDIINFDLFSLPHVELLMNAIIQQQQQQQQQSQQDSSISSSKQQNGMMSAATTNLGPLYCMSTDTECTEQLRRQIKNDDTLNESNSTGSVSDGSTANNEDDSISNEWSADTVYESIFGASIRNLPRSLHLQPIYDDILPDVTKVNSYEGSELVVDRDSKEQLIKNRNESYIGAEQQGAIRTVDTVALGAGNRNRQRRQQTTVNLPIGVVASVIVWDKYLDAIKNVLIKRTIYGVLKNTCGQGFVYYIEKGRVDFLGPASNLQDSTLLFDTRNEYIIPLGKQTNVSGQCSYALHLYNGKVGLAPVTLTIDYSPKSSIPMDFWALWLGFVFMVIFFSFRAYDKYVTLRTGKVLNVALRGERILSTLFPKQVRERMFAEDEKVAAAGTAMQSDLELPEQLYHAPKAYLKSILNSGTLLDKKRKQNGQSNCGGNPEDGEFTCDEIQDILYKSKPIADLFPETTVLFADIAGFTAWSSVREPCQVFILLETLYRAFDIIAKRRRVFKVETVGDCYVAAAGLPDPIPDHAVAMARFARDCMETMSRLVKTLERSLGPDTADLTLRVGIHSGPVTAGVLRGDRSRFQLFGDTMNTAARMEQSGKKNRIQLSEETHRLLCAEGKARWMVCRQDKVSPKGKGEMITYWLLPKRIVKKHRNRSTTSSDMTSSFVGSTSSVRDSSLLDASAGDTTYHGGLTEAKVVRLVDWNVKVLQDLLKRIAVRRKACPETNVIPPDEKCDRYYTSSTIEEVREIINLPKFDNRTLHLQGDPDNVVLPRKVVSQLHLFVQNIAAMYHDNPFHNFEHASHVLMSVSKLLNRIIAPDIIVEPERLSAIDTLQLDRTSRKSIVGGVNAAALHDHTYGITSDPLTHFACVFSALIHDCDHPGVPNAQLVKEDSVVARHYKNQSVAEQNSISLAWALLMQDEFIELRGAIYRTDAELKRFRELVVNSVLATDIVDKDLKALRNDRWDTAFDTDDCCRFESTVDATNRKATIVIEHLIQASDISHTMQHWHVYRKWNELFFMECYDAYANGRAEKDPSEFWYKGEIGFFDFYVIPLAKKLKECGVFGVSSDEYLNYATKNRQEWEERGIEIVNELVEKVKRGHARRHSNDSASCLTVEELKNI